jgi:hypothetical protein
MSPIVVSFPVYNRPHLLRTVLESWSRVRGIQDAVLEFHCEPGCPEAVRACREVDFTERRVFVNAARLGHALNVLKSMNSAFWEADYAIQALDDFIVSTDILELHAWHRERYRDDPTVLALTSGRDVPAPSGGLAGVWRCQLIGANSGFHKAKWEVLASRWTEGAANWWAWVNEYWLQSGQGYDVLFPALSRADDIGDWHPATCFVPDPPPQAYHEMAGIRELATGFTRRVEVY